MSQKHDTPMTDILHFCDTSETRTNELSKSNVIDCNQLTTTRDKERSRNYISNSG